MRMLRTTVAATAAALIAGLVPAVAAADSPDIVINEVESQAGSPDDWIELYNRGGSSADLGGWLLSDNSDDHLWTIPAGTTLGPGEFLVIDIATVAGGFGLGGADSARLFGPDGVLVDAHSWTRHSGTSITRCPDGSDDVRESAAPTKGAPNDCAVVGLPAVAINEVNSNSAPGDFIELHNFGPTALDLGGYLIKDDDDSRTDTIPAGTVVEPGGFLVLRTDIDFAFGLGKADSARLFLPDGTLIDSFSWTAHGLPGWARCADGTGEWAQPLQLTPGYGNCGAEPPAPEPANSPWPGPGATVVLDTAPTFLEDSSGLDFTIEDGRPVLYAVDNGTGTFWKLDVAADGSVTPASGWADGRRARFARDADNPAAKGPDAEGITVAGDGMIYIASERDNSDKGINYNVILRVNPTAPGPDVVADREWDLTGSLPAVSANTGIEAVEWVADAELAGRLWDARAGRPYDPADYPGHGDGLFFVAVEDNGLVYAYALAADGSSEHVATLTPGLGGVMALDYDETLGVLWAMCDDGCAGTGAQLRLNGTSAPDVTLVDRPAGLPDTNNEGFATSSLCIAGERSAWWFTDGVGEGALRRGALDCTDDPVSPPSGTGDGNADHDLNDDVDPDDDGTPQGDGQTPPRPGLPSTGR